MNFWPSDSFSEIADWCGIIGLGITLFLTWTTVQIKGQLKRKERLPEQLKALIEYSLLLRGYLDDFEAADVAIDIELGAMEGVLIPLQRNLKESDEKEAVKKLVASVLTYRNTKSKANFIEVCSRLRTLSGVTHNTVRELDFE